MKLSTKSISFDGTEEGWITFKRKAKSGFEIQEKSRGILTEKLSEDDPSYGERNEYVYHALMYGLEGEALHVIDDVVEGDGKAAWEKLLERYDKCASMSKMDVYMDLVQMGYMGYEVGGKYRSFHEFVTAFEAKYKRLVELGEEIQEKMRIALLLNAIPRHWETIRETLELQVKEEDMTWAKVTSVLKPATKRKEKEGTRVEEMGLHVNGMRCFRCNKPGHVKSNCPDKEKCQECQETGHRFEKCPKVVCHRCQETGHIRRFCPNMEAKENTMLAAENVSESDSSDIGWVCVEGNQNSRDLVIDCAANVHVCPHADMFEDLSMLKKPRTISGLGKHISVQGVGKVKMGNILLEEVRYAPDATQTLVSSRLLARKHGIGLRISADETGFLRVGDKEILLEDWNGMYMFKSTRKTANGIGVYCCPDAGEKEIHQIENNLSRSRFVPRPKGSGEKSQGSTENAKELKGKQDDWIHH